MGRPPDGERDEDEIQSEIDDYVRGIQPPPEEILKMEGVFQALSHPRRRYLVYSLLSETKWSLQELATKLVAWERDISEEAVTENDRDEMFASLYHLHVPKLTEQGVIKYQDGENPVIVASENAVQVLAALKGLGASVDAAQEVHARSDYEEE